MAPVSALEEEVVELHIPEPLANQLPFHEQVARWKVGRWGRRRGKSREAFIAATIGHGPGWREGRPLYPGILTPVTYPGEPRDVVWIGKNNPQTTQIWLEEVMPRFDGVPGIDVNQVERRVSIEGHGSLHVRSAEAIASVRGIGALIKGIILDEAGWFPFFPAWREVLRPIAMDNEAWAMIFSTTNAADDGELDELGNKIRPSGFNRLCLEIMTGIRTLEEGWWHEHGTARDNPKIKPEEFAAACREYPADSISLAQEMEAKLVTGGAGVAFPEWRDTVHIVRMEPPPEAVWFGGMDWGYHPHPAVFLACAAWGDRQIFYRRERVWRETTPYTVGYEMGELLKALPPLEWIGCDPSMDAHTTGASIVEEVQRGLVDAMGRHRHVPVCVLAPRSDGSRRSRKMLLHEGLRFEERTIAELYQAEGKSTDELDPLEAELRIVPSWLRPAIAFHPDCVKTIASIPQLPRDPKGKEDVDTRADDHAYDAATYPLLCRVQADRREPRDELEGMTRDTHPGFTKSHGRPDPWHPPEPRGRKVFHSGFSYRRGGPDEQGDGE